MKTSGSLGFLHLVFEVDERPHDVHRGAIESYVVVAIRTLAAQPLEVRRELLLKRLRLSSLSLEIVARHEEREEQSVLHHDVGPEQTIGDRQRNRILCRGVRKNDVFDSAVLGCEFCGATCWKNCR